MIGCDPHLDHVDSVTGVDAGQHPDPIAVGVDRNPSHAGSSAEPTSGLVRPDLIVTCLCRSERHPEGGRSVRQRAQPCRAKEGLVSRNQTTDDQSHSLSLPTRRP